MARFYVQCRIGHADSSLHISLVEKIMSGFSAVAVASRKNVWLIDDDGIGMVDVRGMGGAGKNTVFKPFIESHLFILSAAAFYKRSRGFFTKAHQLCMLSGCQIQLLLRDENGIAHYFNSNQLDIAGAIDGLSVDNGGQVKIYDPTSNAFVGSTTRTVSCATLPAGAVENTSLPIDDNNHNYGLHPRSPFHNPCYLPHQEFIPPLEHRQQTVLFCQNSVAPPMRHFTLYSADLIQQSGAQNGRISECSSEISTVNLQQPSSSVYGDYFEQLMAPAERLEQLFGFGCVSQSSQLAHANQHSNVALAFTGGLSHQDLHHLDGAGFQGSQNFHEIWHCRT